MTTLRTIHSRCIRERGREREGARLDATVRKKEKRRENNTKESDRERERGGGERGRGREREGEGHTKGGRIQVKSRSNPYSTYRLFFFETIFLTMFVMVAPCPSPAHRKTRQ